MSMVGEMDRRTFMKTTLAAGAAVGLMGSVAATAAAGSQKKAELADLPLVELSAMIRDGKITSKELVDLYLGRIKEYGGPKGLNAYITVAADSALKQAEELDRLAKDKKFKGVLHGLPIAIKDNLDTSGIKTTGGSKILADWVPSTDAQVVEKLKQAGAIVLGKTNMHEFAFGITTNNPPLWAYP